MVGETGELKGMAEQVQVQCLGRGDWPVDSAFQAHATMWIEEFSIQ